MTIRAIRLHLIHTHGLIFLCMSIDVCFDRRLAANTFYPLLLTLFPHPLRLPPHTFHIPIRIIFNPTLIFALFILPFFLTIIPPPFFKHGSPRRFLRLSGLILRGFLIQSLLLPFRKRFGRDGCEGAGELVSFRLEEVFEREGFQGGFVHQGFLGRALFFGFEDEAGGETVSVHALVAAVWTGPEPAVLAFFDGVDEVFADFVGGGFGVAVFAHDDLAEFFFEKRIGSESPEIIGFVVYGEPKLTLIPIRHVVLLFRLFFSFPSILV